MSSKKHSVVVTTINTPTESIERIAAGAKVNGWDFVVAGDTKSPDEAYVGRDDLRYLGYEDQKAKNWAISDCARERSYTRKMFGYLAAIEALSLIHI